MFSKRLMQVLRISVVVLICSALLFFVSAVFLLIDIMPKTSQTRGTIWVVKRRILLYAHEKNRLPSSLADIPKLPSFDNSIMDAWGWPLHYQINDNGTVTLKS